MALDMADSSINLPGLSRENFNLLNQPSQDLVVSSNTSPVKRDLNVPLSYYSADLEQKLLLDKALSTFNYIETSIYHGYNKSKKEECFPCTCKVYLDGSGSKIGCDEYSDCINRLLLVECKKGTCPTGKYCRNQRFQRKQNAKVNLTQTEKKGYGILAAQDIEKGDFVMEYVGEVIGQNTFVQRTEAYNDNKAKHFYFMSLKSDKIIDATSYGSLARFINHSCNPNCILQKWMVGSNLCIGIFTIRDIKAGEEITFDYKFERYGALPQACYCGESNCKGILGSEKQSELRGSDGLTDDPESILAFKGLQSDQDCSEVVKLMLQLSQNPEMALVLLKKIGNTQDESLLKKIVRLHGVVTLKAWLEDYSDNKDICMEILSLFEKFPFSFKNKLEDLDIYGCLRTFGEANPDEKERIEKLIAGWEKLPKKYIIPRLTNLASKVGSDSPPVDADSPKYNRFTNGISSSISTPALSNKDSPPKKFERDTCSSTIPSKNFQFPSRVGSFDISSGKDYQPFKPSRLNTLYSPISSTKAANEKASSASHSEKTSSTKTSLQDSKIKSILEKIANKNGLDSRDSESPNFKQRRTNFTTSFSYNNDKLQSSGLLLSTEVPKTVFEPGQNSKSQVTQLPLSQLAQPLGSITNIVPPVVTQPRNGYNLNVTATAPIPQQHGFYDPQNNTPVPNWMPPRPFMIPGNMNQSIPNFHEASSYSYQLNPNFPKPPMNFYGNNPFPTSYAPMLPASGYMPAPTSYNVNYVGEQQTAPVQVPTNPALLPRPISNIVPFMNSEQVMTPSSVNSNPPPGANLPPNWRFAHAPSGQVYYYNTITQETSWERPNVPSAPQLNHTTQRVESAPYTNVHRFEGNNYTVDPTSTNRTHLNLLSNNESTQNPLMNFNPSTIDPISTRFEVSYQANTSSTINSTSISKNIGPASFEKRPSSIEKPIPLEKLEARCTKLFSIEVVNIFSRFKHEFTKDVFKKHAAKMTHLLVDKEKRLSSFMNGKLYKMTPELRKRIKDFTIDYAEKLIEKKKLYEASKA